MDGVDSAERAREAEELRQSMAAVFPTMNVARMDVSEHDSMPPPAPSPMHGVQYTDQGGHLARLAAAASASTPSRGGTTPATPDRSARVNALGATGVGASPVRSPRPKSTSTPSHPREAPVDADGPRRKQCNCKYSRCLKLYCECFASGSYCENCNCQGCLNNGSNEAVRADAVQSTLERNPNAFRPKIAASPQWKAQADTPGRHSKGCHCKKSSCLKKYCECFQAGIVCSANCKCLDCKNFHESSARRDTLEQANTAAANSETASPRRARKPRQTAPSVEHRTHPLMDLLPAASFTQITQILLQSAQQASVAAAEAAAAQNTAQSAAAAPGGGPVVDPLLCPEGRLSPTGEGDGKRLNAATEKAILMEFAQVLRTISKQLPRSTTPAEGVPPAPITPARPPSTNLTVPSPMRSPWRPEAGTTATARDRRDEAVAALARVTAAPASTTSTGPSPMDTS